MSKHTPGPWGIDAERHCYFVVASGKTLAEIFSPEGNDSFDARLIAAAPELLDALKAYRLNYSDDDLQTLANITSGRGEISPNVARREIIARAAIAKAEGRGE